MGLPIARICAVWLWAAACCGCVSAYVPAVIIEQTPAGRSELSGVIAMALHRDRVRLADDALTATSSLAIERPPVRDEQGLLLNGRELSKPELFRLYAWRGQCVLEHSTTDHRRWVLRSVKCQPASGEEAPLK